MKGVYLLSFDMNSVSRAGVAKKVKAQMSSFDDFFEMSLSCDFLGNSVYRKILKRFPLSATNSKYEYKEIYSECDFIYIRYNGIDFYLIRFLKRVRKENPQIKILLEIPTYPIDGELKSLKSAPILLKDKYFRRYLCNYVDRIVTFSCDTSIWGIPTIRTINGIDVKKIKLKDNVFLSNDINLLCVASFRHWNGYERLIEGLSEYYRRNTEKNVNIHFVGDGKVLDTYKRLVKNWNIQKYVFFYGFREGKELDEIANKCSIGISSLGLHRIDLKGASTLKLREYLARGLPVVIGYEPDIFTDDGFKYCLQVPANDTPVDIFEIVKFYLSIYENSKLNYKEIIMDIRNYALKTCDINVTMKPVIDYIKNGQ